MSTLKKNINDICILCACNGGVAVGFCSDWMNPAGNICSSTQATQATDIPQEEHLTCEAKAAALCFVCESVELQPFRPYLGYTV